MSEKVILAILLLPILLSVVLLIHYLISSFANDHVKEVELRVARINEEIVRVRKDYYRLECQINRLYDFLRIRADEQEAEKDSGHESL